MGLIGSLAQGHFSMDDVIAVTGTILQQVATNLSCSVIKTAAQLKKTIKAFPK